MRGIYPYYSVEPIADLRDLLLKSVEKFGRRAALQSKVGGKYRPMTYRALGKEVEELSSGLNDLGIRPGDKVAIMSENRPEWAASYLAIAAGGAVCVPVDKELREQEVFQILYLSEARAVVTTSRWIELVGDLKPRLPKLEHLIDVDTLRDGEGFVTYQSLIRTGHRIVTKKRSEFRRREIRPYDLAALIFTSGTMGNPKGVMLSHRNLAANVMDTCRSVYVDQNDRFLSILPLHHTYECTCGFLVPIYRGATISYGENLRRLAENIAETKSTVLLGVPLLFNSIYEKICQGIAERGESKFRLGKGLANLSERVLRINMRKAIFRAVHKRFGGHLRILISGGAAADPAVARGFRELGITFIQGYGLTEASPLVAVNREQAFKDDAAGLPLATTDLRIEEDEILVRGDNVMHGYYRNPDATTESIRDGWLHTGDLGKFDEDGFLYILGRKKSVIVTKGGKNIYPEEVEAELLKSPYILECLVWGGPDSRDSEVQAIIVPNIEHLLTELGDDSDALTPERIEARIREEVRQRCDALAAFKRVKRFTLREEEFAKTTTRKIKRYLYTSKPSEVLD